MPQLIHGARRTFLTASVSIATAIAVFLVLGGCSGLRPGKVDDGSFTDLVGADVVVHAGLLAVDYSPRIQMGGGLERSGEAAIVLLNHTDEWIDFDNVGYGQRIFQKGVRADQWQEVQVRVQPISEQISLAPELTEYDIDANNIWLFQLDDLAESPSGQVRVFFIGRGRDTGTIYGAFVDYELD